MEHAIRGVPGTMKPREVRPNGTFKAQKWVSGVRPIDHGARMQVEMRFDDECRNGHNDFAITAHTWTPGRKDWDSCDCLHDEIAQVFPELAPLIKWHLSGTAGPMHYIANTVYMAGDKDCNGLRKGEKRQIKNGRTGLPCWSPVFEDSGEPATHLPYLVDSDHCPPPPKIRYEPHWRVGEGKDRDLETARRTAVWPEATDEELCSEDLAKRLEERLPALLADLRADMESIGFLWEAPK